MRHIHNMYTNTPSILQTPDTVRPFCCIGFCAVRCARACCAVLLVRTRSSNSSQHQRARTKVETQQHSGRSGGTERHVPSRHRRLLCVPRQRQHTVLRCARGARAIRTNSIHMYSIYHLYDTECHVHTERWMDVQTCRVYTGSVYCVWWRRRRRACSCHVTSIAVHGNAHRPRPARCSLQLGAHTQTMKIWWGGVVYKRFIFVRGARTLERRTTMLLMRIFSVHSSSLSSSLSRGSIAAAASARAASALCRGRGCMCVVVYVCGVLCSRSHVMLKP